MNDQQKEFQEKLRSIYKAQDTIEPLVEGLEGISPKTLKDFYIKLHTTIDENDEKNQNSSEKISSKKQEIELENMFDKLSGEEEESNKTSGAVNKLLILGGAGVGKSTMMKYIAYKWGEGELWKDRFDYVYRVPLKILLDNDWKSGYVGDVFDYYPLKCLVHYYLKSLLPSRKEKAEFKLENVVWTDDKNNKMNERILLLLDGYDEAANFQDRFKGLFEEAFEFENIILTSRPNAMEQKMAKNFDRKIENTGLGNAGINQYFNRYFVEDKEKGKEFQKFLARNPAIKEICNIPVNIAMLCFIWSEKSADLEKISSMSDLYGQVMNHLGVRYMARQQPASMQNSQDLKEFRDREVQIDELKVLQHVAYKSLIGGELEDPSGKRSESQIIKGKIGPKDQGGISIQSSILYLGGRGKLQNKEITVSRVHKYGLLKTEGGVNSGDSDSQKDTDLQNMSFSFLHLSFQEYLTAQYLVEQLERGAPEEQARIANFIARHRNEPRLALVLKFMAGILRANPNKNEAIIRTIKIFWDTILCNPNGSLELGTDAKVNLLMHLLSQVKENEVVDARIPNQELAVKFIDCRVLENILWWVDELKESDYISPRIKEGLLEILLKGDLSWSMVQSQELSQELSLKLQREPLDKDKEVFVPEQDEVLSPAQISSADQKLLQEEISGAISSLILKFTQEEQNKIIQKLLSDIKKNRNDEQQFAIIKKKMSAMIKIAQTIKLNPQDSQAFIEILLENIFYKTLGLASRRAIQELLKVSEEPVILKGMVKESLKKIKIDSHCKSLQAHLKGIIDLARAAGSDDFDFIKEIIQIIIPLLESTESKGRERAEEVLTELVEECSGDVSPQILRDLLNILISMFSKNKKAVRVSAANTIVSLINCKVMKANGQLVLDVVQDIIPLLGEQISGKYYRVLDVAEALVLPLFDLNKEKVQEIAELLILKLKTSNPNQLTEITKRLEIIAQAYGNTNVPLIRAIIESLTGGLKNENFEVRLCALDSMRKLAQIAQDRELCLDVIKALPSLLRDEKKDIREKTLDSIIELFQISPSADIELFKEIMRNLMDSFNNFDPSIRSASSKSLKNLVMKSGIPDLKWLKEVCDALVSLTEEESVSVNKREIAFDTILDLARMKGTPVKELIETFGLKMEKASPELKARMAVMVVRLERIAGNQDIQIVKNAFDGLSDLLENDDDHVRLTAAKNMLELLRILIVTDDVQLMKTSIARFCVVLELQEKSPTLQAAIVFYITELFKITGDKSLEFLDELIPVLVPYVQERATVESKQIHQVALLGVVRLFKASNIRNLQITQNLIKGLIRNQEGLIEAKKFTTSVQDVIRVYNNNNQGTLSQLLIPLVKSESVGKIVSEEILGMIAKDSQIIENVQGLLNEELLGDSTPKGKAQIFKLKLDLIIKDGGLITEKIQSFITTVKPFLQSENFEIKQNAFAYLTEAIKTSGYKDAGLIQDLLKTLDSVLSAIAKGQQLESPVPNNILKLLEITENKDKSLLRKVLLFFIENPQSENGEGKRESCCWVLKLLKKENDKEFLDGVLQDVIPKLDLKQHAGLVQKLSVFLLPHIEIIGKYLDHPNLNMRKNFRAGVLHYFKIYLNRFEVLEELIRESNTKELTLKEINEKLFDKIVDEDGCCSKRQSNLSEAQLNNDKEALRSLLASEIDRAEARQGIEIVQLAFLAIAKVEYSKYQVEKKLPEQAWEVIRIIHRYLKKEKLTWVSNNYERLIRYSASNAAAIKAIFGKLYHKILEDSVITPLEERLITLFIQQGLTTSLTKKGEIVFQDVKYEIKGNSDMRFMLEKIARVIIGMDQDLLAKQYKTNTPIFEKSYKDGGIQEAAVDVRKIISVVDKKFVLRNDFWVLTSLRPLNAGSEIVLLEQRSAFGDHIVYKLKEEGESFEELQENFSLEDIFGKYQPDLIFNGRSKILSSQRGQELVKETWKEFKDIKGSQEDQKADLYYHQELLKAGETDRIWRIVTSKQDNPLRALDLQLQHLFLQPQERIALQEYYEGFISTFNSVYIVSIAILHGKFSIETKEESKFSPTSMFKTLVALIPVVGEKLSEEIDKLIKRVKDNEFKNNAEFMTGFAVDVVDLSDRVSKIAREKIRDDEEKRKKIIEAKDPDPSGKIAEIKKLVTSKIEELKRIAIEITKVNNLFEKEIEKSPAFRLGQRDANEMIKEWFEFNHSEGGRDMSREDLRERFIKNKTKKGDAALQKTNDVRPAACLSCQIF